LFTGALPRGIGSGLPWRQPDAGKPDRAAVRCSGPSRTAATKATSGICDRVETVGALEGM
jgi:hypothetical protein